MFVFMCHKKVKEWETEIKQEQVTGRKREREGKTKIERVWAWMWEMYDFKLLMV